MAGTFGNLNANDTGDWNSNKEMNPAANSSVTEDGLLSGHSTSSDENDDSSKVNITESESGSTVNPGRTPGKAEGVEDAEERGNQ